MILKDAVQYLSDRLLRLCEAWSFCIGTVAHECEHALLSNLTKPCKVDCISKYRCIIYLEIACMHNYTCR